MAIGDVEAGIIQLNKPAQWFIDNADEILGNGQHAYLNDDSGDFKKGDGIRTIGSLPWIVNGAGAGTVQSVNSIGPDGLGNVQLDANDIGADPAGSAAAVDINLQDHVSNTNNPHSVTKTQVGLGNVDNTADTAKPVSTAQQTALNLKQSLSGKDATGGYVGLTLFKINFKNALNTITSFFTNANTAIRTYAFQNRDGIIADDTDLLTKQDKVTQVISGGVITIIPTNTARVAAATYYIVGSGNFSSTQTDFALTLSGAGAQRYVGFYGNTSGTITKVEGSESAYAAFPTQPANTALIGYVLVGDANVGTTPDLSGYMLKSDKATQADVLAGTNDSKYVTAYALQPLKYSGSFNLPLTYTGLWRGPLAMGPLIDINWGANLFFVPYIISAPHTVTQIRVPVTTGVASQNLRLGLYSDSFGRPLTLIEDSGNISAATSGEKSYTFTTPKALTGQVVWMAICVSSNSIALRYFFYGAIITERVAGAANGPCWSIPHTFGALPATIVNPLKQVATVDLEMLVQ